MSKDLHDPLQTTFWQFNNIVPIVASILSAAVTVGLVYLNMVRRIDKLEYQLQEEKKATSIQLNLLIEGQKDILAEIRPWKTQYEGRLGQAETNIGILQKQITFGH